MLPCGFLRTIISLTIPMALSACMSGPGNDDARREIRVIVIYTDRDTINAEARNRGFRGQANGFYDAVRNEIWCPNEETPDAFRTCGHELRHVVVGAFHR